MELLYKNRSQEDQDFIKYVCNDILSNPYQNKPSSTLFAGVFIDGRNREINSLEDYACFHSFSIFSEYSYPIYVFVHNVDNFLDNNQDLIKKYNIQLFKIKELRSLEEYSSFCIRQLYTFLPRSIENIITLQPDAMLIKSGYEKYLLDNDFIYIGAPWLHAPAIEFFGEDDRWHDFFNSVRIGNGGMSYRKASFCRQASEVYGNFILREKFAENNKKPQEDLFFAVLANLYKNTPTIEQARKFSIDPLDKIDYNNKTSYAFHYFSAINPWKQTV
jgi:hypothetical protein